MLQNDRPKESPCRILVMASGFGSNFQALIHAISTGQLRNSRIISIITNRRNAHAIVQADEAGIPWGYFKLISNGFLRKGETDEQKVAEGRQGYDAALAARVLSTDKERPGSIVLAGWMQCLLRCFPRTYRKGRGT
ncbi:hypothetical protein F5X99DRAFT_378344 [Biscogniauxia marginata]|nr:hypothetical protein F5X99DRAFT_378344 [Biscogniauxia marginata]